MSADPGLVAALAARFGDERVRADVPLAPLTTFRVGGPADVLLETRSAQELIDAVRIARARQAPVRVIGGGSNVLVNDEGVRGLVIRPRGGEVNLVGADLVRVDAAVTINGLVRWTINRGLAGLEAWAGTPGTVGGAIYGNAHWKKVNIGDLVESVRLVRPDGTLLQVPADRMEFAYDDSRLKRTGEVVVWAAFRVQPGAEPERAPRHGTGLARVPQAHAAARVAQRRLHLHEPRSVARQGPGRAFRHRRGRSSIAPD